MNLPALSAPFSRDLAIDLGTANTLVFARDHGIVVDEPSVIAVNKKSGKIEAVGSQAKEMVGRTPDRIEAIAPMRNGVIADFTMAEQMLSHFVKKAHNRSVFIRPRIVISVPSGINGLRSARSWIRRTVRKREKAFGGSSHDGCAGAGLPVTEPTGSMVVDIGAGTTGGGHFGGRAGLFPFAARCGQCYGQRDSRLRQAQIQSADREPNRGTSENRHRVSIRD